jgi:hypothetical protein
VSLHDVAANAVRKASVTIWLEDLRQLTFLQITQQSHVNQQRLDVLHRDVLAHLSTDHRRCEARLTSLLMSTLVPINLSNSNDPVSFSAFRFPPWLGIENEAPPRPRTTVARLDNVTRPPWFMICFNTLRIFQHSTVTSFVMIESGSRRQLSQIPQVVTLPPGPVSESEVSQAAADREALAEKY